ncbi:cation diffusion facilitator family transporter [Garciella nitratireducens]|uniref:Cation diffusion facilitator family transporter n=1 Tax=Garciella nitratireducens DSM 15102 TaxID=1121911 RepID=A0A1T4MTM9_9FIRM|nr:cation diffusion facilitator family transporter [Garciella nitratireducens]RBP44959.1 cation diffusion facilitator family transporter [Garciella nitratireducens]SJZ70194.1 cation diffusion facilitator family transporter [Garciella nitratireducens DSM 15102]
MENKYKQISKILWIIFFANISIATLKIIFGALTKTTSLIADGYHSFTDGFSNIIGLIGIRFASKPIDKEHPYGHKKFETIASLFIAGMLLLLSIKVVMDTFYRFLNPVTPQVPTIYIFALMITIGINILISQYEYKKGIELKSDILKSDAIHTKSDIFVSIGVLFTLIFMKFGFSSILDPLVSFGIALIILHAAYKIFSETCGILVDKRVIEEETIKKIILQFPQVNNVHKIRNRGKADDVFIDMHILTNPNMSIEESHDMVHKMEKVLNKKLGKNVQLVVHLEPYNKYREKSIMKK